ncbi:hypothetical protein CFRS1_v015627 [Colletotrichum fructicola]|nr:hypothetical protein CFRS1_v015627 [Colletotrichum fructicola]
MRTLPEHARFRGLSLCCELLAVDSCTLETEDNNYQGRALSMRYRTFQHLRKPQHHGSSDRVFESSSDPAGRAGTLCGKKHGNPHVLDPVFRSPAPLTESPAWQTVNTPCSWPGHGR